MNTPWFFWFALFKDALAGFGAGVLLWMLALAVKRAAVGARRTLAELQALGDLDGEGDECRIASWTGFAAGQQAWLQSRSRWTTPRGGTT